MEIILQILAWKSQGKIRQILYKLNSEQCSLQALLDAIWNTSFRISWQYKRVDASLCRTKKHSIFYELHHFITVFIQASLHIHTLLQFKCAPSIIQYSIYICKLMRKIYPYPKVFVHSIRATWKQTASTFFFSDILREVPSTSSPLHNFLNLIDSLNLTDRILIKNGNFLIAYFKLILKC